MEWICIAILAVAVVILSIKVGTQKKEFQKPIIGDFNDLYNFLGIRFEDEEGKLKFTNVTSSPFGGMKSISDKLSAVLNQLGLSMDSEGNVKIEEVGYIDAFLRRINTAESTTQDLISYLGITWDKDGKCVGTGYGLSGELTFAKGRLDGIDNLLATKVDDSQLNTVADSVAALQKRLEEIRKSAGLLENFEVLMEIFQISEENAKTLVEKEYKDLSAIAGKDELDFIKSCGLEVETASAIHAKAKELTEKSQG